MESCHDQSDGVHPRGIVKENEDASGRVQPGRVVIVGQFGYARLHREGEGLQDGVPVVPAVTAGFQGGA